MDTEYTPLSFEFPPELRIKKRRDFLRTYSVGKSVRKQAFTIFAAAQEPPLPRSRLGVTATKKAGKSNIRNRLRRRAREAFRLHQHQIAPGWDLVMNLQRSGATLPWALYQSQFLAALNSLGILLDQATPPSSVETSGTGMDRKQQPCQLGDSNKGAENDPGASPAPDSAQRELGYLQRWAIGAIQIYQRRISRFLPSSCRFYPTCSQYAVDAFRQKSFLKATGLTAARLLRCHPFHPGGYDPVE